MNDFSVLPTLDRIGVKDEYIINVNSYVRQKMHLGKFAVVTYYHPNIDKVLKIPCIVVVDENLGDNIIRVDQTLRMALGIDYGFDTNNTIVKIHPLKLTWIQILKSYIASMLGKRFIFFRVSKAYIQDMEKNLCRIPPETHILLGCEVGDSILLESLIFQGDFYRLKEFKIKAYISSEKMIENREKNEEQNINARYPSAELLLNIKQDIPRIFLDLQARKTLQIDSLDSIRVSRDIFNLFLKQIREFGIIFFLSILAGVRVFPFEFIYLILISILIALTLVLINIRSKIK